MCFFWGDLLFPQFVGDYPLFLLLDIHLYMFFVSAFPHFAQRLLKRHRQPDELVGGLPTTSKWRTI